MKWGKRAWRGGGGGGKKRLDSGYKGRQTE